MNQIENQVYTLTDEANSIAAELYNTLEQIRYDPVGAMATDAERMEEINRLLRQALEQANTVKTNVGKG